VNRRASVGGALLLATLVLSGCRAYDARYWSFPLNSMQMVDDAVVTPRSYGSALGRELAFQLFPWSWVVSAIDILMLSVTLPYDLVELLRHDAPFTFEQQVAARRNQGVERPLPAPEQRGRVLNDRHVEHLEPAEH
jgi:hypothetical protein